MATFSFAAISEAEALAIAASDTVEVAGGTASQTTVLFNGDGKIAVTVGDRTVLFSAALNLMPGSGRLQFADGSMLFIGDALGNAFSGTGAGAMYGGDGADSLTATGGGAWLLQGNQGDDNLWANPNFANVIYGGQGNDLIQFAGLGSGAVGQFAQGNKGDDRITGGNGGDTLLGGQGADVQRGNAGVDFLNGNLGDDSLLGSGQLLGEGGDDSIAATTDGATTARGGDGNDRIASGASSAGGRTVGVRNTFFGDGGADTLTTVSPEHDELYGGDGDDVLQGFVTVTIADLFDGGSGNDSIQGARADETLNGGAGNDTVFGGGGSDVVNGEGGDDSLSVGVTAPGMDLVSGGEGNDTIVGSIGVDTLSGGAGNDRLSDFGGDSGMMDGGDGDDFIVVSQGSYTLTGGAGNDTVDATGAGPQTLSGGAGNDSLHGSTGAETLFGDDGADTVNGGGGADVLFGGDADRFDFVLGGGAASAGQLAQIRDWSIQNTIHFRTSFTGAPTYVETTAASFTAAVTAAQAQMMSSPDNCIVAVQVGFDVIVFSGTTSGTSIDAAVTIVGRTLDDLSMANFA